jgi:hypothetical protein
MVEKPVRQTNRIGKPINRAMVADEFGNGAEWYLTVRCAGSMCRRLIAFQKAVYSGNQPNLRIAVIGEPSVNCPYCRMLVRIRVDQIERRRILLTQ